MKANTVLLDLETYNMFRDFQKEMLAGNILTEYSYDRINYLSKSEVVEQFNQERARLNERIDSLNEDNSKIRLEVTEEFTKIIDSLHASLYERDNRIVDAEKEIKRIKGMSFWQFLKWRKS